MGSTVPASINFCVLGRQETAPEFGKVGTSSDITIHDKKARDVVRTWVTPNGFPEKIPPLFQAICMSEHVVFYVNTLDRFTGEQIIALDMLQKKSGILCHTYEVDESRLDLMIRGTVVEGYSRVDASGLADAIGAVGAVAAEPDTGAISEVVIDHSFDVKGVGTVILGRVARGMIRQYDNLALYPAGSDVLVKSIQMHDDPVDSASYPARVGLAVKGIKPCDMQRGDILAGAGATDAGVIVASDVMLEYSPSKFYKGELSANQGCMVSIGLQARAATVSGVDKGGDCPADGKDCGSPVKLSLKFAKPIVCHANDTAVILRPEATPVRIAGCGRVIGT